jgi:hypothetical protein
VEPNRVLDATSARLVCGLIAVVVALLALTLVARPAVAGPELVVGLDGVRTAADRSIDEVRHGLVAHKRQLERKRARAAERAESSLGEVENEAGEPLDLSGEACADNVALAASKGLRLPDGWEMHCVGPGLDWNGGSHWGVTCPYEECPEGAGPYVSISNPTYYVVAHELCHANFGNDEQMADNCAAEHGASLDTSPYR